MSKDVQEVLALLLQNTTKSFEQLEELLKVPEDSVAPTIRNAAFMRRLRICFISLYEYLSEKATLPEEYREKSLEDIADYLISKQVLTSDDKEPLVLLGSVYAAIRWSKPGIVPHEEKIMEELPKFYDFIKRVVSYHSSQVVPPKEAINERTA